MPEQTPAQALAAALATTVSVAIRMASRVMSHSLHVVVSMVALAIALAVACTATTNVMDALFRQDNVACRAHMITPDSSARAYSNARWSGIFSDRGV